MTEAAIRRRYTEMAEQYIEMFGAVASVDPDDLTFLNRHLGRCEGPVLDAGCGPGHLTAYLSDLGLAARGIDLVPAFIDSARSSRPELDFAVGTVHNLDVADQSLSGILAWYSLIHCDPAELPTVFAEFRRALSPNGILVVGFFEGASIERFDHKVTIAYRWPADELSQLLSAAGFVEIDRLKRAGTERVRPHSALAVRAT